MVICRVCRKPEQLVFSIYNNGPLIELEMVEKLLNEQGKGYGIHNIKERLELYYGALGSLEVKVTDAKYTCFTVKMPDTLQKKNPK
jgi:two-component system sensor histidine kinase YesM